ncbi:MAG: GAF domain-containing protein, partial [Dehalococcoidia bacterium]
LTLGVLLFANGVFTILARVANDVIQRNRELSVLTAIASTVGRSLDANEVMVAALDKVLELMGMEVGEICLWAEDGNGLVCVVHRGLFAEEFMELSRFKFGEDIPGLVAESGKPLITYDLSHDDRFLRKSVKKRGFQVLACVPLKSRGKVVGTLDILSRNPRRFTPSNLELLESVGNQIGMALENIRLYSEAVRQSEKLRSLNEAGLSLTSELSLEAVLQKVVDLSRELVKARYAALGVLNEEGEMGTFVVSGVDDAQHRLIGALPKGKGLLGDLLRRGEPRRIRNIAEDLGSAGFPPHHPPMTSFLGVPILLKGKVIGDLYLTDKEDAEEFTLEDEQAVAMLAAQAAIAIENARLYQQVQSVAVLQERDRIAREIHDGLAQTLGYLNLKLDYLEDLLCSGEAQQVAVELEKMREVVGRAYADVRESIVGLRAAMKLDSGLISSLEEYLQEFGEQSGLAVDLSAEGVDLSRLDLSSQIQLVRIVQEALTNVRKHAQARLARVRFSTDGSAVRTIISDDGIGFDASAIARPGRQRFGLHIMKERAESLGGSFSLESRHGEGTKIVVDIPMSQQEVGQYGKDKITSGR